MQVRLREFGKVLSTDSSDQKLNFGDICIVKIDYEIDYGKIVSNKKALSEEGSFQGVVKILRKATSSDLEQIEQNRRQSKSAVETCREKVDQHRLPMRIFGCEFSFDRQKIIFYFTAAGRVDFRNLVRDLASVFKARIDLHQLGPRDEAKMIGGIAPCGKTEVCCTQFMGRFETITTRMAKIQRLPVRQEKLLGLCGQLKCCLKFELDTYEELSKSFPEEGTRVSTKLGRGRIMDQDILRQRVIMRLEDDRQVSLSLDEITVLK
ncbi:MAG: stage 0 sporulation protein [Chlamydiae bacterium]|nr:stage 0 sporulation protein [Chlamydiota bacterium]MBI3276791.1 stage 0 sporulation protein [Chlamydiota bacterium]